MRSTHQRSRRPFWLPASNYYVLAVAIAAAFFFLLWGILHEGGGDETPWVPAGIGASVLLIGAVVLREAVLRRAHQRYVQAQAMARRTVVPVVLAGDKQRSQKLSLEQITSTLDEIRRKSDAAKVLDKFSAGHREVYEICSEYLIRSETELKTVAAGSPRLPALLKGRSAAAELHKYHLMRWAEIESRAYTNDARNLSNADEKIVAAKTALAIIESALESYPVENALLGSRAVLRDLIASIRVGDLVEQAERAAFGGDYPEARRLYKDAIYYLGREDSGSRDRQEAAARINDEIERLMSLEEES